MDGCSGCSRDPLHVASASVVVVPINETILRARGVSEKDLRDIRRQQTGGIAGAAGLRYEDHYAVHCLVQAAQRRLNGGSAQQLSRQAFCFVDDLLVRDDASLYFYQIKKSPKESWKVNNGKLARAFRGQLRVNKKLGGRYRLAVVNPFTACVDRLRRKMPRELKPFARVEQFPLYTRRPEAWALTSGSDEFIRKLLAFAADRPNQREQLMVAFYTALEDVNPLPDGFIDIDSVITQVRRDERVPLRSAWTATAAWTAAEAVIKQIPEVEVRVDYGFCHFRYRQQDGLIARCDTKAFSGFVSRVNKGQPTTFEQLEEAFP